MNSAARMVGVAAVAVLSVTQPPTPPVGRDVFALVRSVNRAGPLWPGFDPGSVPLAFFDGETTWLLRHPSPPEGFSPVAGRPGVFAWKGPHPAVAGNSTREIGGVRTATVVASPDPAWTALALPEEVFHVFWTARHPAFRPNEMARYAYPVDRVENARLLLAENEALARALEAPPAAAAAWAATALGLRRERVASLGTDERAFETSLEMLEGTANCVARRAVGETAARTANRLRAPRAAEEIRWRFYDSGAALCLLLDRFEPAWKGVAEKRPDLSMEEQLGAALAPRGAAREPRKFTGVDMVGFRAQAARSVAELARRREVLRGELAARPGARVVVELAPDAAFRFERFDPIRLFVLGGGEVVHAKSLALRGAAGSVELTNPAYVRGSYAGVVAITASAGGHPFAGARRLTVVGLAGTPRPEERDGVLRLHAPGFRLELAGAAAAVDGETVRVTVGTRRRSDTRGDKAAVTSASPSRRPPR